MQQQTLYKLEKERDLGEIVTDTFAFIRIHFKDLSQVFTQTILPIILLSTIASVYYQFVNFKVSGTFLTSTINIEAFMIDFFQLLVPSILAIFSSLVLYVISYLSILGSIKSYQLNGKIDVEFVKTEIKSRFWSMTGLMIIAFLVLVFAAAFCFLPFLYFIVPVSIMFPILIFEDKSVNDAFSYAFTLIRENYWITLGTIIIMFIIIFLASGIFQIPILLYTFFATITKLEASSLDLENLVETDWVLLSLTALADFGSSVLSLVTIISGALIYFNLNEKHNLTGTVKDIDSIGSN